MMSDVFPARRETVALRVAFVGFASILLTCQIRILNSSVRVVRYSLLLFVRLLRRTTRCWVE
jgi:hypothetical protein